MQQSAGILLCRRRAVGPEFFLVHPGGPYFARKDAGWWTIPKGEPQPGEELLQAAVREFEEGTGFRPEGTFIALQPVKQKGAKVVHCWTASGDLDAAVIQSNYFELEWPPRSGQFRQFPEIDKAGWFGVADAVRLINVQQRSFIEEALLLPGFF